MARKIRIEYEGAIYHVMNRGDRREPIFKGETDYGLFLQTLAEACAKTGWQVHAWCLLENHFHLVVETPQANLVVGMKWLLGTYSARFNRRYKLAGHVFAGRYKALVVEGSGNGYLRTVCEYVHLNPVRAHQLPDDQSLRNYCWSSVGDYLKKPSQRPVWLRVDRLLGEMGIPRDSAAGRKQFERQMEMRRAQATGADWEEVRREWCLGKERFRQELLAQVTERLGEHHYGAERRECAAGQAERIIAEALAQAGWMERDLALRRKGDPVKVALAMRLRKETTMTVKWVTDRLHMGSWAYLNRLLYEARRNKREQKIKR